MQLLMCGVSAIAASVAEHYAAIRLSGVSTPVGQDASDALALGEDMTDAAKRPAGADCAPGTRRRISGKAEGTAAFVPPCTPARSDYEADLMQAYPAGQGQLNGG